MNTKTFNSLVLTAGLITSLGSANAALVQIDFDVARGVGTNGFVDPVNFRVGQGGTSARFAAIAAFSVQDILSAMQAVNPTVVVGDLATSNFFLTFDTLNAVELPTAGTYTVAYRGFAANADIVPQAFWTGIRSYNELTSPTTGVADTLALQTGITSLNFNLTGITENDTANDYVLVGIGYTTQQPTNTASHLGNFQLNVDVVPASADVIPEPSVALLSGIGMLALLRRRR